MLKAGHLCGIVETARSQGDRVFADRWPPALTTRRPSPISHSMLTAGSSPTPRLIVCRPRSLFSAHLSI